MSIKQWIVNKLLSAIVDHTHRLANESPRMGNLHQSVDCSKPPIDNTIPIVYDLPDLWKPKMQIHYGRTTEPYWIEGKKHDTRTNQ